MVSLLSICAHRSTGTCEVKANFSANNLSCWRQPSAMSLSASLSTKTSTEESSFAKFVLFHFQFLVSVFHTASGASAASRAQFKIVRRQRQSGLGREKFIRAQTIFESCAKVQEDDFINAAL